MENHKHRIKFTAAQIIQFTGHMTFINVVCSTTCFGEGGGADVGFGGPKKVQSKRAFCTLLVQGRTGLFH
jgi:hypothetical protein